MRFTPLATTVYLSHLTNLTLSHHLSSIRLPECVRNERCFFCKGLGEEEKKYFQGAETGNDILI